MKNLQNKVVMITGASSGFGEATARKLVEHGALVALGARRVDRLEALAKDLGMDKVVYKTMDVSIKSDVKALVDLCIEKFGKIDALINNAGIMPLSMLAAGRTEEWDQMIDVNIKGLLYGIDAVLNHMLNRGTGNIVNLSSVGGHKVMPSSAVYSGTKFAVRAISEGLRQETAGKIQVTTISPGIFSTELGQSVKDETIRQASSSLNEISQPAHHVADAIPFALNQDPGVAINEIVIRPTKQEI